MRIKGVRTRSLMRGEVKERKREREGEGEREKERKKILTHEFVHAELDDECCLSNTTISQENDLKEMVAWRESDEGKDRDDDRG